jgi:hypothetical protein
MLQGILFAGLSGCATQPVTPPTPPVAPPVAVQVYPARPTTYWTGKNSYGVALCYNIDEMNLYCWYPPANTVTVK